MREQAGNDGYAVFIGSGGQVGNDGFAVAQFHGHLNDIAFFNHIDAQVIQHLQDRVGSLRIAQGAVGIHRAGDGFYIGFIQGDGQAGHGTGSRGSFLGEGRGAGQRQNQRHQQGNELFH